MNTKLNLEGTIHKIEQREGDGWSVRTIVLWEQIQKQDGTSFDKYVAVDFFDKEMVKRIDAKLYPEGSKVAITASLSSKNTRDKWWTSIRGMDIHEPFQKPQNQPQNEPTPAAQTTTPPAQQNAATGDPFANPGQQEDMPF